MPITVITGLICLTSPTKGQVQACGLEILSLALGNAGGMLTAWPIRQMGQSGEIFIGTSLEDQGCDGRLHPLPSP